MSKSVVHYFGKALAVFLLLEGAFAYAADAPSPAALAEQYGLKPGMKITKENADLIKDLVPEAVYNHTKNGDYIFLIGQLPEPDTLTIGKLWDQEFIASTEKKPRQV